MKSPPDLLLQRARNHRCLPVEDAWAIALAWQSPLQGKVLLEVEGETVYKSYTWVQFDISVTTRTQVSAARAAALAWFVLSCCPGYSGCENPVFWRSVFSELAQLDEETCLHIIPVAHDFDRHHVTDAFGFFDRDSVEFPRFRLSLPHYSRNVRLFCGLPDERLEHEDKRKLQRIMDQLATWIDNERTIRRPHVTLYNIHMDDHTRHYKAEDDQQALSKRCLLEELLSDIEIFPSTWPEPIFLIDALAMLSSIGDGYAPLLLQRLNRFDVNIELNISSTSQDQRIDRHALAAVVHSVLPLPRNNEATTSKTTALRLNLYEAMFPAFLSSLPHATSVHSVELSGPNRVSSLDEQAMAWLAYVLLHPDTPSSTWKRVKLSQMDLSDEAMMKLKAMARGNNLAALLHGSESPTSNGHHDRSTFGYYRATLAVHAAVYDRPITSLWKRVTAARLLTTSDASTTVEVSGVSTDDPTQWDDWVPVVVPGYGLGWVQSVDVTVVEKRRPAKAALTALRLDLSRALSISDQALPILLEFVGRRLVHLEINCRKDDVPADVMRQLLANCPSLQSLAAPYRAALWNDGTTLLLPRLRELQLRYEPSRGETISLACLPQALQVLRIDVQCLHLDQSNRYGDVVRQLLSQPSCLRLFHWQEGLERFSHAALYTNTYTDTARRLEKVGVPPQWQQFVHSRLPPSHAAAFLSVPSAQRLDPEVARMIVVFAGSRALRSIVLEPVGYERGWHGLI